MKLMSLSISGYACLVCCCVNFVSNSLSQIASADEIIYRTKPISNVSLRLYHNEISTDIYIRLGK